MNRSTFNHPTQIFLTGHTTIQRRVFRRIIQPYRAGVFVGSYTHTAQGFPPGKTTKDFPPGHITILLTVYPLGLFCAKEEQQRPPDAFSPGRFIMLCIFVVENYEICPLLITLLLQQFNCFIDTRLKILL